MLARHVRRRVSVKTFSIYNSLHSIRDNCAHQTPPSLILPLKGGGGDVLGSRL